MSVHLTKAEVDLNKSEIKSEFERLFQSKRFAVRTKAKQWEFFRHCFNVLMGEEQGDFPCDRQTAAQYKFEVANRLGKFYQLPGARIRFVFTLVHKNEADDFGASDTDYPAANEYMVLVSQNYAQPEAAQERRAILERVVTDAIDAEWAVYKKLPELDLQPLEGAFDPEGPAYKRIQNVAVAHHKRQWTISNPLNPSTRRLIDIKVHRASTTSAEVRTVEYWYLRWWSEEKQDYTYIYNETNRQRYFLVWQDGQWLVKENIYPTPRASTPRRWKSS